MRALKMAAGVGTVLVLINHGDKLLNGSLAARDALKIAVTYCVPFCVSAFSAASALAAGR
ncbi:MAG: nitrate/nitrite transporter NrtS [Gammaproteobacteria bacterium]